MWRIFVERGTSPYSPLSVDSVEANSAERSGLRLEEHRGRQPGFYVVATVTLALGIGANAAIFTVVNAVLLRPLPYPQPDRLMMVWTYNPRQGFDKDVGTYPNFEDWRRASTSFERMSAYSGASVTLTGSGDPAQIRGGRVDTPSSSTRSAWRRARGRAFAAANGQAGGERVVILAHGLWTRRFGAIRRSSAGRIVLNGVSHEVLGVMPERFAHPGRRGVLGAARPGRSSSSELFSSRGSYWLTIIGRLKPGDHARGGSIRNGRDRRAAGEGSIHVNAGDRCPPRADARRDRR